MEMVNILEALNEELGRKNNLIEAYREENEQLYEENRMLLKTIDELKLAMYKVKEEE